MTRFAPLAFAFALVNSSTGPERVALADTDTSAAPIATPAASPLYSLPWQLRPVTIDNVVRVDSAAAVFDDDNRNLDVAAPTMLTASYQLTEHWAPTIRLGFVANDAPGAALDGSSVGNPITGATYARRMGSYRLALSGATTIPIGMGGGDAPNPRAARTNTASIMARPADSAMFEVDYLTEIVGVDVAYVNHGFTAQGEATLLQGVRVRGSNSPDGPDTFRTNSALALHVGYFVGSHFSLGGDLRYQRWLSHPTSLDAMTGARVPLPETGMDTLTVTVGPRLHLQLGEHAWIRPGISYTRGVDAWTHAVQIDVPVLF